MKSIQVFDKPLCCSTGVCGPQVDPVLPRFAADLDWLRSQGLSVDRFNLAQEPAAFVKNRFVQDLLTAKGPECLPLTFVDGTLVSEQDYPTRDQFIKWTGLVSNRFSFPQLSIVSESGCCSGSDCC